MVGYAYCRVYYCCFGHNGRCGARSWYCVNGSKIVSELDQQMVAIPVQKIGEWSGRQRCFQMTCVQSQSSGCGIEQWAIRVRDVHEEEEEEEDAGVVATDVIEDPCALVVVMAKSSERHRDGGMGRDG